MVARVVVRSDRVKARFARIPDRVQKAVNPAVVKSAEELVAAQKALAPVDTGRLRDSIAVTGPGEMTPRYSQPGGRQLVPDAAAVVTAGNSETRYPHLVEYGTREAAAQPYFWPAYRLLRTRMARRIKSAITKAIKADRGL